MLKPKVEYGIGLRFEVVLLFERQSDSIAAPVWHAETVSLIHPLSEVRTIWKGFELML